MDRSQTENAPRSAGGGVAPRPGGWAQALSSPLPMGLLALLGIQILAAVLLSVGGQGALAPAALDSPLLQFDPQAVTEIRIEGGAEGPVTLAKADQGWVLAGLSDFPADASKVDQLLEKLADLKRPLPIATSAEAQRRHKVADDAFERKITLESGDKPVATLLLGESPGFRRVLARPAGESAVYDLDLPLFDVSNRRDDWLARDNLRLARESIERIHSGDWTLVKNDGDWTLDGSDQKPDAAAVSGLVSRLANLGYRGVLGSEDKPEYDQTNPVLEITVGLAGGAEREYRVSQAKDSKDFVLKVSDRPWYFKLSELDLEGLKDLDRNNLTGTAVAPEGAETVDSPSSGKNGGEVGAAEETAPPVSSSPAAEVPTPADAPGAVPTTEEPPSPSRPK